MGGQPVHLESFGVRGLLQRDPLGLGPGLGEGGGAGAGGVKLHC